MSGIWGLSIVNQLFRSQTPTDLLKYVNASLDELGGCWVAFLIFHGGACVPREKGYVEMELEFVSGTYLLVIFKIADKKREKKEKQSDTPKTKE
uniref:Uncharacterized protein n=1 Tax=Panagrolaimus sp. JU765 TaxID=591449 RepID=A0AC34R9Q4_9BILA